MDDQALLDALCRLARQAGEAILEDKKRVSQITLKPDESPLTSADLASNQTIVDGLEALDAATPLLSEESAAIPYEVRKGWSRYFLVDPLDGTKEFIKGRKEYTVNIALVEDGVPVMGVVYVPELDTTYFGGAGLGAFKSEGSGTGRPISVSKKSADEPRVVGSSSHPSPDMVKFLELVGPHRLLQFGSSLKICQVAEGAADVYPRFGPTSEWDTAAGHAVVLSAGGRVVASSGEALLYNQKESLLNPSFFVLGPEDRDYLSAARAAMA